MSDGTGEIPKASGASAMFGAYSPASADAEIEKPEMRSVAVMRAPTLLMQPPSGGLRLAKPPPLGIARPLSVSRGSSDTLKVKQTWTGVTAPCVWEVTTEDLELVPIDFPLERTHRTIEGADAVEVSKRISHALRTHSIEAEYVKKPAKARCKTNDFVSFRIRLYAGSEKGLPVVVEVQRRSGSGFCFMKSCRAILAAAEGNLTEAPKRTTLPIMKKPVGQMNFLRSVPAGFSSSADDPEVAIGNAVSMVRSSMKDINALGLENLLALTDPIKTSTSTAIKVSKFVIIGDDKYDIRDDLKAFTERDVFEPDTDDEETVAKHADHLRHLALTVFANALVLCARSGCLGAVVDEHAWYKDQFMLSLVDELKLCRSSASCSVQAARCIGSLLESSASARRFLESWGVRQVLEDAHSFGIEQNDLLSEESGRCLKLLDV